MIRGDEVMNKEKYRSKEILLKQISKIDEHFDNSETVPYEEARNTLLLVGMVSKIKEKHSVSKVSDLRIRHSCYHTLQRSYRTISKEASIALNNITDNNLAIILGQFGILQNLEEYLEKERDIPLNILMEMNARTVKSINESAKTFKKINNVK